MKYKYWSPQVETILLQVNTVWSHSTVGVVVRTQLLLSVGSSQLRTADKQFIIANYKLSTCISCR